MDEELISKREILEKYGISYGALYRWKRMGLIPESWFIRRSTVTGQETYFQKERICQRIELILSRKEKISLEELAVELQGQHQKQQSSRKVVLETRFERREYRLDQLCSAVLTDGETEMDLLQYLKEVML